MIENNLAVLQVVVPLIGAPLCMLFGRGRAAWAITLVFCLAAFVIALGLLEQVMQTGPIRYDIGRWAAPYGIEYRIDQLSALVLLIVSGVATAVVIYGQASIAREIPERQHRFFYACLLLTVTGLLGMTTTADAFNLFVLLEIASLASYALISMGRHRRALYAAYQYLILGTVGATFYVIGVGLLYMVTGTLNMADLAARIVPLQENRVVLAGFGFLVVGLGLKVAMFPLHLWLPNAYTHAPSAVSALLAATATKVGLYVMIRVLFGIFGPHYAFTELPIGQILVWLGMAGAIAGAFLACFQDDVKRLLAYSSVSQVGYIILGIGLASQAGLVASTVHIFNHALMKGTLFMAVGCFVYALGGHRLADLEGAGRKVPVAMAAFVLASLSMIGLPGTVGFVSKWLMLQATIEGGWWLATAAILVSSLLAVAYSWRVIEVAYFRGAVPAAALGAAVSPPRRLEDVPPVMLIVTVLAALSGVYFGLDTRLPLELAQAAANAFIGGTP